MTRNEVYKLIENHYRKNAESLFKKLSGNIGGKAGGEDIVQEAYCRACTYWYTYNDDRDFDAWFSAILKNSMLAYQNMERHQGAIEEELDLPSPYVSSAETKIQIQEMIDREKPIVSDILTMYFIKDMKQKEIGQVVNKTPKAVERIISKFRHKIKRRKHAA